jgi:hypothetical protein
VAQWALPLTSQERLIVKHIRPISVCSASSALQDFFSTLQTAWSDFVIAKKNQLTG